MWCKGQLTPKKRAASVLCEHVDLGNEPLIFPHILAGRKPNPLDARALKDLVVPLQRVTPNLKGG